MMFISTQFAKLNLLYLSTKIMLQKIIKKPPSLSSD